MQEVPTTAAAAYLQGNQRLPSIGFGLIALRPLLRNFVLFCLFETAFYFAYRYGMSFSQACAAARRPTRWISGIELQRQLAASGERTPVIFITAHDAPEPREQALAAGCTGYFRH